MQKKPYLTIKFEYNKRYMGKDAYYPSYPFTLDGPIFHNSIVEDALTNANLRTSMIVIDPDKEEGKNQSTFAFLYQNPTSVEKVGITNKIEGLQKKVVSLASKAIRYLKLLFIIQMDRL